MLRCIPLGPPSFADLLRPEYEGPPYGAILYEWCRKIGFVVGTFRRCVSKGNLESAMLPGGKALYPFVIGAIHALTAKKQRVTEVEVYVSEFVV